MCYKFHCGIFFINSHQINIDIMKKLRITFYIVITIVSYNVNAHNLLHFPSIEVASIGIYIEDLNSGQVIVEQNANKVMTPASVMKSITSAAAMLSLSNDFQFETYVYAVGDTVINNGILNCDIVINACGDPTIESKHFATNKSFVSHIVNRLSSMNIREIKGKIRINSSKINFDNVTSTWMVEDLAWDYGTELKAFNYKDNRFDLCLPSSTSGILYPKNIPDLIIENQLLIGSDNNISLYKSQTGNFVVSGTIKPSIIDYKIGCSMPNPSQIFIEDLNTQLTLSGIKINDNNKTEQKDTILLYNHKSPKRDEILRSLMVRSDNLFAEAMMQTISPHGGAIDSVLSKFKKMGVDCQFVSLHDGCGLSRINRLSPRFIADVYRYMYNSEMCSDYVALFPLVGIDGTVRNFLSSSRLKGKLALKTGSMGGVQCYGGYKLNENGTPSHIVIIMVNNFFCKSCVLRKDIERLLLQIF